MTKAAGTTEIVQRETAGALAIVDFAADAGLGYEGLDSKCFAIPLLYMLQDLSAQVKRPTPQKPNPDYIEGALPGMFFNNLTGKVYDGVTGLNGILCFVKHSYNLWVPRDEGGGFRGELDCLVGERVLKLCARNDKNQDIVQSGEYKDLQLVDTRTHYFIMINEDGSVEQIAIPFTSTAVGESKKWVTMSAGITKGVKPMFSQIWNVWARPKHNASGDWTVPAAKHVKEVTQAEAEAYHNAKAFYSLVVSGPTVDNNEAGAPAEEIPF